MKKARLAAVVLATTISVASVGCSGHVEIDSKEIPTAKPSPLPTYKPQVKDFKVKVNQTAKQCFRTAGCNISFRIVPTYNGPPPDPTKIFEVTYKVTGGDAGSYINSFTFQEGQARYLIEEFVSVKTDKIVPQVTVTQVTEDVG